MQKVTLSVSKKVDSKHVQIGTLVVFVPTLAAFSIPAEQAKDDKGALLCTDEGMPVYTTDAANWLQAAITAQAKVQIRNKLVAGTIDLKDGQTIPTTLAELTAEADRSNSGAALEAIRQLKAAFGKWVVGLGKTPATQALLIGLFANKQALALQSASTKEKIAGYVADFAETLDEAALSTGGRYLQSLLDVCSSETVAADF